MTELNELNTAQKICLWTVKQYLGKWYLWGGSNPEGFDCSGLMIEGLKAAGKLPRGGDWTADDLRKKWEVTQQAKPGCLVFWASKSDPQRAGHVEMVVGVAGTGEIWTIGASGGGPTTRTIDDAREQGAYIKIRPAKSRGPFMAVTDPFLGD